MLTANQTLDMTPIGMVFHIVKTPIDTNGQALEMDTANQTLDMTPIGMVFHIVKTPIDTNGQALEMEWELMPNSGGTPLHIHPHAEESYKVLEGQLEPCRRKLQGARRTVGTKHRRQVANFAIG